MPPKQPRIPSYRLHKRSGRAVVTLAGRDIYLGLHGTPESRAEYDRLIAEWLAHGRSLPSRRGAGGASTPDDLTVSELILAYWRQAKLIYPADTQQSIKAALRSVRRLYGHTAVADFGPVCLRTIQRQLEAETRDDRVTSRYCRSTINDYVSRVRHVFKWGVAEGLVPGSVWHSLQAVAGLRRGRTTAREPEPVRPVADEIVDKTLPAMPPAVADMVRVQRLTGMRPGEICALRAADLDTSGKVWLYRPPKHKTAHLGKERVVAIGPRAQAVLKPYLAGAAGGSLQEPLFQPARSELLRKRRRREQAKAPRRTPLSEEPTAGRRKPSNAYAVDAYRRAIVRACRTAKVPTWAPNQLRHTRATEIRKAFGLDGAGAVLGHTRLETTQVYADRDAQLAQRIALETG